MKKSLSHIKGSGRRNIPLLFFARVQSLAFSISIAVSFCKTFSFFSSISRVVHSRKDALELFWPGAVGRDHGLLSIGASSCRSLFDVPSNFVFLSLLFERAPAAALLMNLPHPHPSPQTSTELCSTWIVSTTGERKIHDKILAIKRFVPGPALFPKSHSFWYLK